MFSELHKNLEIVRGVTANSNTPTYPGDCNKLAVGLAHLVEYGAQLGMLWPAAPQRFDCRCDGADAGWRRD